MLHRCINDHGLLLNGKRLILGLNQDLTDPLALCQLLLRVVIQLGTELREGRQLAILSQLHTNGRRDLLHGLDLCGTADTGYGKTRVNRRAEAGIEHFRLQIDLTICDGDNICGNIGRYITCLCLNDGKCRKGTSAQLIGQLRCTLQKSGMQVEYVSGICLTSRGSSQKKGQGTVCLGMLGQIIINDENVLSFLHPFLTDGAARIGCDVLKRCHLTCCRSNDGGIAHGLVLGQSLYDICNRRGLLSDGDVDTINAEAFLVNDRIKSDGRLTCLTVTDDQLSLSSSDGYHGVNSLDTGLKGSIYGLTGDNTRSHTLDLTALRGLDGSLVIDGLAQRVDNTSQHGITNRHLNDAAGGLNQVSFTDGAAVTQKNTSYIVLLQVHDHTVYLSGEEKQLTLHGIIQSMDTGDTVCHLDHGSGLCGFQLHLIVLYLLFDHRAKLFWF